MFNLKNKMMLKMIMEKKRMMRKRVEMEKKGMVRKGVKMKKKRIKMKKGLRMAMYKRRKKMYI